MLGFDPVEASGSLLKTKASPMAGFRIDPMGAVIGRRYETQMATLWIACALPFEFSALAVTNPRHIVHERDGVSKHPGIDSLEDVASRLRHIFEAEQVGVVDVPAAIGSGFCETPRNLELCSGFLHRPRASRNRAPRSRSAIHWIA